MSLDFGGGHWRTVSEMTESSVRVALPDGWDARRLPVKCDDGQVSPSSWEAVSRNGSRVFADSAERLLAKLWSKAAKGVEGGGDFESVEAA